MAFPNRSQPSSVLQPPRLCPDLSPQTTPYHLPHLPSGLSTTGGTVGIRQRHLPSPLEEEGKSSLPKTICPSFGVSNSRETAASTVGGACLKRDLFAKLGGVRIASNLAVDSR